MGTESDTAELLPEPSTWSGSGRWLVLLSFAFYSFSNAFIIMDFATDYDLSEQVLDTTEPNVAFLYTLFLICVMPAMFGASWGVVHHNYKTMAVGQLLNVLGAWLRYVAVLQKSYTIAVVSTVFAGASASVIVCSYAVIAERWFRPSQRALATTIAVQSNYAGWALGSLIGLVVHKSEANYRTFALWQGLVVSLCVPLFALCYRGSPRAEVGLGQPNQAAPGGSSTAGEPDGAPPAGTAAQARLLFTNGKYWVYACCYATLGGIGFSVPSAQDAVLGTSCYANGTQGFSGFDTQHTTFTNLSFIVVGVLVGLLLGALVKQPRAVERAVLCLALLGSVAMTALAVLASHPVAAQLDYDTLYACLIVFMALSGVATIGFIGLALNLVVRVGAPVSEAYTVGGVEWLIQGVGGALSTVSAICSVGFFACVALSWLATLVLFLAYVFFGRSSAQAALLDGADGTSTRQ